MKERIAGISILANGFLAVAKIAAGLISRSSSIMAEGIHSVMDIISSAISYWGIKISQKPADVKHPYGHAKIEVLTGVIITIILFATGALIIYEAYGRLRDPVAIEFTYIGFGVMLFSAAANEIMARVKIKYGKKEGSISLISDGVHSRVDVYTSLAVFAGLILAKYFIYADTILAFLIGIYIIKESFSLGKEAVDSLLDVSAGKEVEDRIRSIAMEMSVGVDSVKTQKKGAEITANLEIKLPKDLSVEEATKISETLRGKLMLNIKSLSYVAIQIGSHDMETGYYKPAFSHGFGWQRQGKPAKNNPESRGQGPGGNCVCPKCGYRAPHQKGIPCSTIQCPQCGANLERKQ